MLLSLLLSLKFCLVYFSVVFAVVVLGFFKIMQKMGSKSADHDSKKKSVFLG